MTRQRRHVIGALVGVVLLAGLLSLTDDDGGSAHRGTAAHATPTLNGGLLGPVAVELGAALRVPETTTTVAATGPVRTPAQVRPAPSTSLPSTTTMAPARATTTSTTAATTTSTVAPATTATVAPTTTTTTVAACRNSTDPACGPFRFDPQPGADNPMTVQVVAQPQAGYDMVFTVTLTDPDGVSHGSSLFNFGDAGLGETTTDPCARFGTWDPPAREPASATEVVTIRHTYFSPGTYTARFAFDAGPFDCVDSVTGRGDRPYASSASGTVTVVVT
ncbi:MAG: hypothetical protein ACR2KK_07255 [Acidimicrobiales bacterium]